MARITIKAANQFLVSSLAILPIVPKIDACRVDSATDGVGVVNLLMVSKMRLVDLVSTQFLKSL